MTQLQEVAQPDAAAKRGESRAWPPRRIARLADYCSWFLGAQLVGGLAAVIIWAMVSLAFTLSA